LEILTDPDSNDIPTECINSNGGTSYNFKFTCRPNVAHRVTGELKIKRGMYYFC